MALFEPKRTNAIDKLWGPLQPRVHRLFAAMGDQGFDPVAFETLRTMARQRWLYGYGRTHHRNKRPVTWTMQSKHLVGKAIDVISKKHGWGNPKFYQALHREAKKVCLHRIAREACHLEWRG